MTRRPFLLAPLVLALVAAQGCAKPPQPARTPAPAAATPTPGPTPTATPSVSPTPLAPPPETKPAPVSAPAAQPTPESAHLAPSPAASHAPPSPSPAPPAASGSGIGSIVGTIEILDRGGKKGPAADAVVWIPGLLAASPRGVARLVQRNKQFEPHVVAVGKGGSVSFPNMDRVFHNVFSRTPGADFDLGLYKSGSAKDHAFPRPGVVRVFCNIHPEMTGYVIVLDQPDPVFALTDAAGKARLSGVPAGSYHVRLWHEKGGEQELSVDVAAGREATFGAVLDGSRWRREPHKNKNGEDYPKGNQAYP
jgi:hypothetical protein